MQRLLSLRGWLPAVLFVALVGAACGGGSSTETSSSQGPADGEPGESASSFELLEVGGGDRRSLTYAFEVGQREQGTMTMRMRMSISAPGMPPQEVVMPPILMGMAVEVTGADDDGYEVAFEYTSVEISDDGSAPPAVVQQLRAAGLDALVGLGGTYSVTPSGQPRGFHMDQPADVPEQLRSFVDQGASLAAQLSSALPPEPVGIGARWRTTQDVMSSGLSSQAAAVYRLTELSGDTFTMDLELTTSGGPQDVPGGAKLTSMSGTGTGSVAGSLRHVLPTSATSTTDTTVELEIPAASGQPPQAATQRVAMEMTLVRV